jgi:stalled ribosome rescue protein Dom34
MKKKTGIWIDSKKAVIVSLEENNHSLKTVDSSIESQERIPGEDKWYTRFGNQFLNFEKRKRNRRAQDVKKYLTNVISEIKDTEEVVILGPAGMKKELVKFIHDDNKLSFNLRGTETAESMTENQLVAWVKNYYQ